jgi:heme/copper-type cytochrome/quinol oxidase subunit 2
MQSTGARIAIVIAAAAAIIVLFVVLQDDGGDEPEPTTTEVTAPSEDGEGAAGSSIVNPTDEPKPKPDPEPRVEKLKVEVEGTAPVGGVQEFELDKGQKAELLVTTPDTTDHVHLHGYDLFADLAPGQPAKIEFTADIDGQFEAELEDSVVPIAELTVNP